MKIKPVLMCGAAAAVISLSSVPASAANIVLVDQGGVTGSQAEAGFKIAAQFWGNMLTNNTTIRLGIKFAPLATGVIGSTGSTRMDTTTQAWENGVNATKSNSTLDQSIVLPGVTNGGISAIVAGYDPVAGKNDNDVKVWAPGNTGSTDTLYLNTSLVKAIGGVANYAGAPSGCAGLDGCVTFSSNFGFDFNPTDGVNANTFDFIGVAIHEMGHALGFVSGVDFFDTYGKPNGPGTLGYDLNDTSIFSALDMFRYSTDPTGAAPGTGPVLDLTTGGTKYFSIDGGQTALFGNTFSTGRYNGDGQQASHWKDTAGCQIGNGIMDPTFCYQQQGVVTALDLAAFDAMGWNLATDVLANPGYTRTTSQIYSQYAVPEPATWAMMISGFGFIGAAMRRANVRKVAFAA